MDFIKRVRWSHSIEFGELGIEGSGNLGKVPEPPISLKEKGLGSSINARTWFPSNIHTNHVVVAGKADCAFACDHPHYESQYLGNPRPLIYQITKEDCLSPLRNADVTPTAVLLDRIARPLSNS